MNFLKNFQLDFWTFWGLTAQSLFFSRFILQWYYSEKEGKIVVPAIFWYLSLIGSIMIFIYAIARADFVFLMAGILQTIIYSRNIKIARK